MAPLAPLLLAAGAVLTQAATVTYDFKISWIIANPDGLQPRPVIGINGQWPLPQITANKNDTVIVNIDNQLGNSSTGLHFHGLYQNGTTYMDGAIGVTQCQIAPGQKFKYNFTIDQPGTYWYHAHQLGQYPDGLRGPLIIHDPDSPYKDKYDEELVLTMSDWYHDEMAGLIKTFLNVKNPTGAEPVPDAALMNDTQNLDTPVQPGKTYFLRMVNMAAFAGMYFWIEGHKMRIVEVDGVYTDEAEADMIYLTAAQRCSVLFTTLDDGSKNFPYVASMDQDLFDTVPASLNPNVTGWLVYDDKAEKSAPADVDEFNPFDDYTLVPYDKTPLLDTVDHTITMNFKMGNLGDGANYAFFNDQSYVAPRVPTLYTAMSTGDAAMNPAVYAPATNGFVLKKGEVVEIILNSDDPGKHPFHLHGHEFQAVVRSDESAGVYVGNETFPKTPMRRDTFMVNPQGNIVLRFRADNPGTWLFHCHIQWHFISGLVATMIEAPDVMQKTLTIPEDHYEICNQQRLPVKGNAAGNVDDVFDLKGANKAVPPLPAGFTARGIVALVFSTIAAFIGLAAIVWYGAGDIEKREPGHAASKIIQEARS